MKVRCGHCRQYKEKDSAVRQGISYFCDSDCQRLHSEAARQRASGRESTRRRVQLEELSSKPVNRSSTQTPCGEPEPSRPRPDPEGSLHAGEPELPAIVELTQAARSVNTSSRESHERLEPASLVRRRDSPARGGVLQPKWVKLDPPPVKRRRTEPSSERKAKVKERDGWACRGCGTHHGLHIHHIVYRSEGGGHVAVNLVTLCLRCHELVHSDKYLYQPALQELIRLHYEEARFVMLAEAVRIVAAREAG